MKGVFLLPPVILFIAVAGSMFLVIGGLAFFSHFYTLNGIKSKTVGDGQHGSARWATRQEIRLTYALATGMSFLCTDTKGDLFRNYAGIAKECYGFHTSVIDLRNPLKSDETNLLHLINKYMDLYKADPNNLAAKPKSEKYAKILAKTLINTSGGDSAQFGQNAFFYDSAEGLLTAMFLLVAEYLPSEDADGNPIEQRHIVSVFKLIQELLAPSRVKGKNQFQLLLEKLPESHKARWFAGSALNTAEQTMVSVLSTVLSRLNAFLDSEMEQILCFGTAIDAEAFCNEKSAIFIVLPEEDQTKYFMVSLILQNLYREILTVADENGGRLKNRVVFFANELGTCPPIQSLELMFSASRSRGLMLVPIVQSITGQLQKNYGREGAEIIVDNCQLRLFLDWGIRFGTPYEMPEKAQRPVTYADKQTLEENIIRSQYASQIEDDDSSADLMSGGISQSTKGNADSRRPRPVIRTQ